MSLTKFASFEVSEILDIKGSKKKLDRPSMDRLASYSDYRTDDGYLYVRIRAISSRTNKNHDGWPTQELAGGSEAWERISSQHQASEGGFTVEASKDAEYGFPTFIGKPIFVDHNNSDPRRARGVIADSKFNVLDHKTAAAEDEYWGSDKVDPEHMPPAEVELLLEVDAEEFPKFAKAIVNGELDGFSMGCDVDYSKCSHCGNKASSPDEYCDHIVMKGAEHSYTSSDGTRTSKRSYENCYGIKFFEISGVFEPADETALAKEVIAQKVASLEKEADNPDPQAMATKAPEDVNTLREEKVCPLCGSDMDAEKCDVCGYEEPPEQFQNPDLSQAHEVDEAQQGQEQVTIPAETQPEQPEGAKGESYLNARNSEPTSGVTSSMRWEPKGVDLSKLAAKPQGDEPNETVTDDQTTPVTAAFSTAKDLIQAAKRNQENKNMSNQTKVAADPADPSGKAKKQVDVEGVGGVDEASNEEASKPEGKHGEPGTTTDVTGKGGIIDASNEQASAPDEKQSIEQTSDNAGFDDGGDKSNNSGPTKTWDNSNEPDSAVTDKAYPTAANKGTQPADASGKADDRIDVETPPHDQVGPGTDQWTGTGGNGVTRQADPVTNTPTQSGGIKAGLVSLAALKLADTEVELGITDASKKFDRIAELSELPEVEIAAEHRALAKVKTAGMTRTASKGGVGRLPSFARIAGTEPEEPAPVNDALLDNALFTR